MTPIATAAFACGILGLFMLDREKGAPSSWALWVPVVWVLIAASRPVSMWLNMAPSGSADEVLDGSPVDRAVFMALMVVGLTALSQKLPKAQQVMRANPLLVAFFAYCGISIVWSDFPLVAFKRWIKFAGDLVMVLLVLTERDPMAAFNRFLSRLSFLLIPLSVLFIKYYPELGRGYDRWTYKPILVGVTYNKNLLGMICLLLGVGMFWRFVDALQRKGAGRHGALIARAVVLAQAGWLLSVAHSATSSSCFAMGCILVLWTSVASLAKRRVLVHCLAGSMVLVAFSALFLNLGSGLVETIGRDSTLTGRTELWERIIGMTGNPILGAGFESFWLGDRLAELWRVYWWQPNQAHNGYIEVFVNLGVVGVIGLVAIIVHGYRKAAEGVYRGKVVSRLHLAYIVIAVTYNFTEASFKMLSPVWFVFLLAIIGISSGGTPNSAWGRHERAGQTAPDESDLLPTGPSRIEWFQ